MVDITAPAMWVGEEATIVADAIQADGTAHAFLMGLDGRCSVSLLLEALLLEQPVPRPHMVDTMPRHQSMRPPLPW